MYGWAGKGRELKHMRERAVTLNEGDKIRPRHLNLSFRGPTQLAPMPNEESPWAKIDLTGSLADATRRVVTEVERRKIERALQEGGGDAGRASEILQINYKLMLQKMKDYGITPS